MAVVPTALRTPYGDGASMPVSREEAMAKAPLMVESDLETAAEASDDSHEPVGRSVAPLPGHIDHHCTDIFWILVLVAALAGLYMPVSEALQHGDMSKFVRGFDYHGRMCGRDICDNGLVCGSFVYFCSRADEEGIDIMHPICVDSCPTSNLTSHVCYDAETQSTVLVQDWPTEEFNMKCLQRSHALWAAKEHERKRLAGDMTRFKGAAGTPGLLMDIIASVTKARMHLVAVIFVAIAVGFMYMLFLRFCASFLIHGSLTLMMIIPSAFGLLHLFLAYRGGGIGEALNGNQQVQQSLWMGIIGVSFGLVMCCTLAKISTGVQTAEGCIIATTECLFEIPSILLEPAFSLMIKVCFAGPLLFLMFDYASTGHMLLIQSDRGIHRNLSLQAEQWGVLLYFMFMIAWSLELVHNMTQYILAYVAQRWYFTPYVDDQKVDVPQLCLIVEATCNLFRFHFGSVVFGSLIKTLFRIPKMLAFFIYLLGCCSAATKRASKEARETGRHRCSIVHFFALLRKEGYMDMAISSADYCEATEHATYTMDDSSAELVLNWTQIIFQLGGWILMTAVAALYMAVTVNQPRFTDPAGDRFLKEPDAVIFFACVLGFTVGVSFMNVFDVVGDTILYCYALEEQRHKQLTGALDPYKEDPSLFQRCTCRDKHSAGFLSWMMGYEDDEHEDEDHPRVQYAPRSLKEALESTR